MTLEKNGILTKLKPVELSALVGDIMQLWLAVKTHRNTPLREFERSIFPPIDLNQFRVYRRNGRPVGFVSWAMFTEELGEKYMAGDFDFKPEFWKAGDQIWFIDFIAPFGDALNMAADMKENIFPNDVAYAPLIDPKTNRYRTRKFHGINRTDAKQDDTSKVIEQLTDN